VVRTIVELEIILAGVQHFVASQWNIERGWFLGSSWVKSTCRVCQILIISISTGLEAPGHPTQIAETKTGYW